MPSANHILVVEDDAASRQAMRGVLEMVGYGVACAANGREALDHLRRAAPPSVILLALTVAIVTGLISGFLPAWRAARMSPVDALRNE